MEDIPFAKVVSVIPFAGPQRNPNEVAFWANGPFLVMQIGSELPHRCIKCNRPTEGATIRKRLIWADTESKSRRGASDIFRTFELFPRQQACFDKRVETMSLCQAILNTIAY